MRVPSADILRGRPFDILCNTRRITPNVTGRLGWNCQGSLDLARLRGGKISVVIRISIWIQDRICGFFTIAS